MRSEQKWNDRIKRKKSQLEKVFIAVYELKKEGKNFSEICDYVKERPELKRGLMYNSVINHFLTLIGKGLSREEIIEGIRQGRY